MTYLFCEPSTFRISKAPDAPKFDFVFTVCNQAANEECPAWPGPADLRALGHARPGQGRWHPTREKSLAFQQTYGALRNRITGLHRICRSTRWTGCRLQKAVDEIGRNQTKKV